MYQKSWLYALLFLRYGATNAIVIFHFGQFFGPFTTLTAQKMKISKKRKRTMEILSFNTIVPKIMIICFTVPEIWHVTDVIVIFHFGQFFALIPPYQPKKWKFHKNGKKLWSYHHLTQVCQKSWSYAVLFLRHGEWQMWLLFFILGYFFTLLPPLKAWKIKISKKWKKSPEDIIILQKSTINDNHKMYGSWDMKCNRHFFLAFCAISCPFTPITAQKMKI